MLGLGNSVTKASYSQEGYAVSGSVLLDGTNQHIIITNSVADDVKNIGSMSIWLKLTNANQNDTIMNIHTDTSNDNKIAILFINQGGSEVIRFNSRGGSSNTILDHSYSKLDSVNNGWTHFAATWNRTTNNMAMYLNGSSVATSTSSIANFATTANKIYLGKPGNADNAFFEGNFSSFALFDAALSASDISTIYNSGSPNIDLTQAGISSLVAFLPLDESSGNFIDRTSTGADGVPINGPTQGDSELP